MDTNDTDRAAQQTKKKPRRIDTYTLLGLLAWIGLVLGSLVTILLLIFIAQNTVSTEVQFLGLEFALPLGVLILFAAIAGALIMALFAGFRILQLRMRARKARKLSSH